MTQNYEKLYVKSNLITNNQSDYSDIIIMWTRRKKELLKHTTTLIREKATQRFSVSL